jgi:hypothetical protein
LEAAQMGFMRPLCEKTRYKMRRPLAVLNIEEEIEDGQNKDAKNM